jgi:hypothetical protein
MPNFDEYDFENGRQIIYTSGLNTAEVGDKWHKAIATLEAMLDPDDKLIFVEDDQSRFDLHLTKPAFGFIHRFERVILTRRACKALRRTGKTIGTFPDGTTFTVDYTMASGKPDTALGDTACNSAMKGHIHGYGQLWYSLICGDDSATVMSYKLYLKLHNAMTFVERYDRFGMEIELNTTFNKEEVNFCSARFIYFEHTAIMVPKPGRLLSKIYCDVTNRCPKMHFAWLRSVTTTVAAFGKADPVYAAISKALDPGAGLTLDTNFLELYKYAPVYPDVPREAILSYYAYHYNFTTADYDTLVDVLSKQQYGVHGRHPLLQRLLADNE